jgi:hypothetical protein
MLMTLLPVPWHHPFATRQLRLTHRNRKFVDSPLEGTGFELPVRGRGQLIPGRRRPRLVRFGAGISAFAELGTQTGAPDL